MAIDNHRLVAVQYGDGLGREPFERDVDGTGDVLRGEFRLGEHVYDLGSLLDELEKCDSIDIRDHQLLTAVTASLSCWRLGDPA